MERIGYARVSTDDQHLDLQRDALAQAGCCVIYEEKASGKSAERPELAHALKALREIAALLRGGVRVIYFNRLDDGAIYPWVI